MSLPNPTFIGQQETVEGKTYQAVSVNPPVWKAITTGTTKQLLSDHLTNQDGAHDDIYNKALSSIKALKDLSPVSNQSVYVKSFWEGWAALNNRPTSGGEFFWDAAKSKTEHNGGTVIDPDKLTELGSIGQFNDYFTPAVSGVGCWVAQLQSPEVCADMFGAAPITAVDSYLPIQSCMDSYNHSKLSDGDYFVSQTLRTRGGAFSAYDRQSGQKLSGTSSAKTTLSRLYTDVSTRVEGVTEAEYTTEGVVSIHGMYHSLESMTIRQSKIGVFIGQRTGDVADTFCSRLKVKDLVVEECGTGICASVETGITYSEFEDLHIYRCQIGMRSRDGRWSSAQAPYFNRNKFRNVRFSRCWIGLWLRRGDTNSFYSVDAEGVVNDGNIADIPAPTGLPSVIPGVVGGVPTKAIAMLIHDAPYNRFFGTTIEASQVRIVDYNSSGVSNFNQYYGMQVGESVTDLDRFYFTKRPEVWYSDRAVINNFISSGSSAYTNIDPEMGSGAANLRTKFLALTPEANYGSTLFSDQVTGGGFKERWEHLGNFDDATTKTYTVSKANGDRNAFELFEVNLTVSNQANRVGANLHAVIPVSYSNTNNSALRARVDQTRLNGYAVGGGTVSDTTNTTYITVSVSIVSGDVVISFSNSSGISFDASSIKVSTIKCR